MTSYLNNMGVDYNTEVDVYHHAKETRTNRDGVEENHHLSKFEPQPWVEQFMITLKYL